MPTVTYNSPNSKNPDPKILRCLSPEKHENQCESVSKSIFLNLIAKHTLLSLHCRDAAAPFVRVRCEGFARSSGFNDCDDGCVSYSQRLEAH